MIIWKEVLGYEGYYQVSSHGQVKSLSRKILRSNSSVQTIREKILKPRLCEWGYKKVSLSKNCKGKNFTIHRLMMLAFKENPCNKEQINHIDGAKTNNILENLEWCTQSENQKHACLTGLKSQKGINNPRTKLTEEDVRVIRTMYRLSLCSPSQISDIFYLSYSGVNHIILNRNWTHVN